MAALITSKQVEDILRHNLSTSGYSLSTEKTHGETGTDIIATKEHEEIHIEAIAFKKSPPARAKDFYEIFFRATSRLSKGATKCVIALPARFGMGLHQRALAIGDAWKRIGLAFPELEIWLVDTEGKTHKRTSWTGWLDGEAIL
jgi:hypothetical protein